MKNKENQNSAQRNFQKKKLKPFTKEPLPGKTDTFWGNPIVTIFY
jgi:hypothetical protein